MKDTIIVTLVDIKGSAPQVVGAKMKVSPEGLVSGTVGGGKIENHCIEFAKKMIEGKLDSQLQTWNLQTDIGMSCGGQVSMFFETQYASNWNIAIFGAGHVSQELTRVMSTWEANVKVYDTRSEWVERLPKSSNIQAVCSENLASEVKALPQGTYLVSMTQGHATDVPVLIEAMKRHEDFEFLGVIGSRIKGDKIRNELRDAGVDDLAIERLRCPVGLKIGNNTPPEISISIAAQLLEARG